MKEDATPTWLRVVNDIKELIHPVKLPPLEVSSRPVDPNELKGLSGLYTGNESKAGVTSFLIHVGVIALIIFVGSLKPIQKMITQVTPLIAPVELKPLKENKGGGGGGAKQPLV